MRRTLFSVLAAAATLLVALPAAVADPVVAEGSNIVGVASAPASSDPEVVMESYMDYFFRKTDGTRREKAKKLVPLVVAAAQKENLDPLLVAVIISFESTWEVGASGGIGEVGLMQVHGLATEGFDVATVEGNLAAGCRWLASRIERCGSVEAGVAAYIGGNERAKRSAAFRIREYRAAQKRLGLPTAG